MTALVSERLAWARDLVAILDALPNQQSTALRLLYFERLTDREVAARMGIALSAAQAAAATGMRCLGEILRVLPSSQPEPLTAE